MKRGKKIKIPIIACLLFLTATILAAVALSQTGNQQQPLLLAISLQTETPQPPQAKQYTPVTWTNPTISGLNISQDLNITLNGNLNIMETGELHLTHCILNINNGTSPIQYGVTVYGGMYINESSTITAINPANPYYLTIYEVATFQMNDSRVEYCGHGSGSWPNQQGLVVRADSAWIENNTITNGREGLLLFGSRSSMILNNSAINCSEGFRLENCMYNNLTGNYGSNNWRNYLLISSSYNTIMGNTGTNSTAAEGFKLDSSSHNTLTGNNATNNSGNGIWLYLNSNNNNLTGNTATNNYLGFFLSDSSNNNTLSGNTANSNQYGFRLNSTLYNNFSGNTANSNANYGFILNYDSNNNNFSGNTANSNAYGYGFTLGTSSYNTLSNNNATSNTNYGFLLMSGSGNNNLSGNTANSNTNYGFYIGSNNNTLSGNTANSNGYGFYLGASSYNNLSGNTANSNTNYGFGLGSGSGNNNLSGNTANSNQYGFRLEYSSINNNLSGNNATNNTNAGFHLQGYCSNNYLTGNTAANNSNGFSVIDYSDNNTLTGNTALNCTTGYSWGGSSGNDFTGSVWANYLRVNVTDVNGFPIPGADVWVQNVTVVYATPYFGGSDPTTGLTGLTPWFAVPYRTFTGPLTMTENITNVTVYYLGFPIVGDNPRTVSMSTSHVETFQVVDDVDPTVNITVPIKDITVNTGVIWINGTFNGTGSQVVSITINDTVRFELVEPGGSGPYGVTDTFAFRNKTLIPMGEFGVLVTVQDGAGYTDIAVRHVIVDQDNPVVVITVPPSDGIVNVGEVWINGTFDGTGSQVVSIAINDTSFTLVEPAGGGPYGATGTYCFRASITEAGDFYINITVYDEAGHMGTATIHFSVVELPPEGPSLLPMFAALMLSGMQTGVSPMVYAAVGGVAVVGIAAAVLFYYFRYRRV